MNSTNFDWLNQLPATNDFVDNGILQSLGLETNDLTVATTHGDQDVINYLFDPTPIFNPLDPSASPNVSSSQSVSSKTGGGSSSDGGSPRSMSTTAKANPANPAPVPLFDGSWLTRVNQPPAFPATTTRAKATTSTTYNTLNENPRSRKMRVKKKREPIFVTESPQNAYKKKAKKTTFATPIPHSIPPADIKDQQQNDSSSPSSNCEDENIGISSLVDKQHMTSKERRQLRNKISARNFRVRRKEYITELETMVDQQEDEIDSLKLENKKLTDMNQQLIQEMMQLRLQQLTTAQQQRLQPSQTHPDAYSSLMISPPNSDTNSPPNIMDTLLDFAAFNNNNNTYLSYSLMPTLDLSAILADKLSSPPSSSSSLEDGRELMTIYPLLAPALASIVLRHTFHLHYVAYLSNAFPYNATPRPKNDVLDIMHVEDWISAASAPPLVDNGDDDDPDKTGCNQLVCAHQIECTTNPSSSNHSSPSNDDASDDFERLVLQQQYPYYAMMRLRGLSHDAIIQRCRANMERRRLAERDRRLKAAVSCGKLQTLHAFTSVAATLLRNPSRSPMIAGVIKDTKACQITPVNTKRNLLAAPFRTVLRINHGKA